MKMMPSVDSRSREVLQSAMDKRLQITITHRFPEGWRQYKSTFQQALLADDMLLVTIPETRHGDPETGFPDAGAVLGVSFRMGHKKCMFETTRVSPPSSANSDSVIALAWPDEIQQMRRRVYERISPPESSVVAVRFWRTACSGDAPAVGKRDVRYGELEDISAGGMRVDVADAEGLHEGDTIECLLTPRPGQPPISCEVTLRHREVSDEHRASLGFQFIGLEASPEGRETLTQLGRIVSELHRIQDRKRRR